ncbi:hypothetical protein C2U72_12855 [Prosthecomicrobium hirschii]|uniref:hypothetical protein n=1 Tax=Prosthecodimorpha hirschii TaxID=665126 RepID=UPI00112E6EE7|nr:hypothetical protein [Prosthecomicrobium hirschii]TPQ50563.1 hypothetical protein C2U72_12855 [Prosthecomicrobium hirschii]
MTVAAMDAPVVRVEAVDLVIRPGRLGFAPEDADRIAARWAETLAAKPEVWNGPFFLFERAGFETRAGAAVFAGEGAQTDFASYMDWRAVDPPDPRFRHVFPVGAILTADRRLVVGRMSPHTANGGRLYPPSGSFDPHDLVAGPDGRVRLDPLANILREIAEEIGFDASGWPRAPGWLVVDSGPHRHAVVTLIEAPMTAAAIEAAAMPHMAADPERELDRLVFPAFGERLDPAASALYVNRLLDHLADRYP